MKIKTTIEIEVTVRDDRSPRFVAMVDGKKYHDFRLGDETLESGFEFKSIAAKVAKMLEAAQ